MIRVKKRQNVPTSWPDSRMNHHVVGDVANIAHVTAHSHTSEVSIGGSIDGSPLDHKSSNSHHHHDSHHNTDAHHKTQHNHVASAAGLIKSQPIIQPAPSIIAVNTESKCPMGFK